MSAQETDSTRLTDQGIAAIHDLAVQAADAVNAIMRAYLMAMNAQPGAEVAQVGLCAVLAGAAGEIHGRALLGGALVLHVRPDQAGAYLAEAFDAGVARALSGGVLIDAETVETVQ